MKPDVKIPDDPTNCRKCFAALPLERAEDEGLHCPACGEVHWPPTASGVVVVLQPVIRLDGTIGVLEVQRKRGNGSVRPADEGWCFPSGFTKFGSSVEEDGEREVREESGAVVVLVNPVVTSGDDHDVIYANSKTVDSETATEGHLMVLLIAKPVHERDLAPFVKNRETSARRIGGPDDRLHFSIHRRWKRMYFGGAFDYAAAILQLAAA